MEYRLRRGVGEGLNTGENLTAENRAPASRMCIAAECKPVQLNRYSSLINERW